MPKKASVENLFCACKARCHYRRNSVQTAAYIAFILILQCWSSCRKWPNLKIPDHGVTCFWKAFDSIHFIIAFYMGVMLLPFERLAKPRPSLQHNFHFGKSEQIKFCADLPGQCDWQGVLPTQAQPAQGLQRAGCACAAGASCITRCNFSRCVIPAKDNLQPWYLNASESRHPNLPYETYILLRCYTGHIALFGHSCV